MSTSDTIRILGKDWLDLTLPESAIVDGVPFDIAVTAQNGHGETGGDTDTAYNCELCLLITDQDGDALVYTVDEGGDTMTSGEATFSNVTVTVGDATAVNISVVTTATTAAIKGAGFEAHTYYPEGLANRPVGTKTLVFTAEPSSVLRDSNFTLTVQAQDGLGNKIESATDTVTITLNNGDANDKFTYPNPDAKTFTVDLVAGEKSITTLQITGGTGTDAATITASAEGYVSDTTSSFNISTPAMVDYYLTMLANSYAEQNKHYLFHRLQTGSGLTGYNTTNAGSTWSVTDNGVHPFKIYVGGAAYLDTNGVDHASADGSVGSWSGTYFNGMGLKFSAPENAQFTSVVVGSTGSGAAVQINIAIKTGSLSGTTVATGSATSAGSDFSVPMTMV